MYVILWSPASVNHGSTNSQDFELYFENYWVPQGSIMNPRYTIKNCCVPQGTILGPLNIYLIKL